LQFRNTDHREIRIAAKEREHGSRIRL
jgi:hypothetical protein